MKQNTKFLTGILVSALVTGVAVSWTVSNYNKTKLQLLQDQIHLQSAQMDSIRSSNLPVLMRNVLDITDGELNDNPKRTLSDETISRIAALCYAAKPYLRGEGDSLHARRMSPERGQLLLFLTSMKLDTNTMQKIKQHSTFEDADLREADLKGADLRGINLRGANLKGAHLQGANLSEADLSFANLWGVNASQTFFIGTLLKRADLSWADLNGADMRGANLHEADAVSSQLRKANLIGAFLQWTDFSGAFLNEADLSNADMFRANLKRAHLVKTNLAGARMGYTILSEANLIEAKLSDAELDNLVISEINWLDLLDNLHITEAARIQAHYKVIETISHDGSKYLLKKNKTD